MGVVNILAPKQLLLALLSVFCLLFGSAEAAVEYSSSEVQQQDPNQPADSLRSPYSIAVEEEPSRSEADVEPPLHAGSDTTEQRLQTIRESLEADEDEGDDEPLIGETDLRQDVGIPLVFNDAVEHYITYFTTTKKEVFKRWLKRKRRYAPLVKEILREHGLPEDLVYLAMIESGFNLQAYSPMKAAGPWQFIPETGRRYGLAVNHWVDERRDIRKSTVAAARYLEELFDQFDSWYLAAAAYNAGENRIDRLIKRHGTNDFWQLRAYNTLPRETQDYVPQLVAAAIIAKDPEKYGLGDIDELPPFESVRETVPGGVPLKVVAEAASTDLSSIKILNPEIRRGITPPGKDYRIRLPVETDCLAFQSSLTSSLDEGKRVVGVTHHRTVRRDSVRRITKRYGVSKEDLTLVNGPLTLKKGALVYIPRFDEAEEEEEFASLKTAEPRKQPDRRIAQHKMKIRRTASHVVQRGETLSAIAAKYRVDVETLKRVNRLKTNRIEHGMNLSLASYVQKTPQEAPRKYHRVRRGETLSVIAEKYGKTQQSLRKLNQLKSNVIQQGVLLRISSSRIAFVPAFS
jgi:membrane-bound lytic murein transglycosylase D